MVSTQNFVPEFADVPIGGVDTPAVVAVLTALASPC
jgi:hypothetical protein